MLRIGVALLLVCASAQVMAHNGRNALPDTCSATVREADEADERAEVVAPRASATRSRYATPAAVPGGGGEEPVLPRARGAKWHNFLPGMFR